MMLTVAMLLTSFAAPVTPTVGDTMCVKQIAPIGDTLPDNMRKQSPLDSVSFTVGGKPVKVCYGRPSLRGREMVVGDQNPWGEVWRTGANEPTIIYTSAPTTIAGVKVPAGVHSLYTIPNEKGDWDIIINKGTTQWGLDYDESKDLGRGKAKSEALTSPVEQFTIKSDAKDAKELQLEWQKFRVHIPVAPN